MANLVGTVGALWRYPVESLLGARMSAAALTERGLEGDRRLAVLDHETGKVASAKNPRLWRSLLTLRAVRDTSATRVTGPDGKSLLSTDARIDDLLSTVTGRTVTLADTPPAQGTLDRSRPDLVLREGEDVDVDADAVRFGSASPPGTFFDFAPVHLITTSTLRRLAVLNPRGSARPSGTVPTC